MNYHRQRIDAVALYTPNEHGVLPILFPMDVDVFVDVSKLWRSKRPDMLVYFGERPRPHDTDVLLVTVQASLIDPPHKFLIYQFRFYGLPKSDHVKYLIGRFFDWKTNTLSYQIKAVIYV